MIDTAEKRRSAIDFGKFCGTGMPVPSGNINVNERAHVLNLYYGIVPGAGNATKYYWRNRSNAKTSWLGRVLPSTSWQNKKNPSTNWQGKVTPGDGTTQREE